MLLYSHRLLDSASQNHNNAVVAAAAAAALIMAETTLFLTADDLCDARTEDFDMFLKDKKLRSAFTAVDLRAIEAERAAALQEMQDIQYAHSRANVSSPHRGFVRQATGGEAFYEIQFI